MIFATAVRSSFAYALGGLRNIVCVLQLNFELRYVIHQLYEEFGVNPMRADAQQLGALASNGDAVYLTAETPSLALFTDARGWEVQQVDAVASPGRRPNATNQDLSETAYLRLEKRAIASRCATGGDHPLRAATRSARRSMRTAAFISSRRRGGDPHGDPRVAARPAPGGGSHGFLRGGAGVPVLRAQPLQPPASRGRRRATWCRGTAWWERDHSRSLRLLHHDIPFKVVGCSSGRIYHLPDSPSVRQILDQHILLLEHDRRRGPANCCGPGNS